jgi:hypothetical protein
MDTVERSKKLFVAAAIAIAVAYAFIVSDDTPYEPLMTTTTEDMTAEIGTAVSITAP